MPEGSADQSSYFLSSGLIGAMGELPAIGLLALYVDDADAGLAKELIDDYLSAEPEQGERD